MRKKVLFIAVIASTFTTPNQAASNPASVEYVQSQINSIRNYIQSEINSIRNYIASEISSLPTIPTYTVGQQALGGTVFYVDSTGTHGLVAASSQNATNQTWNGLEDSFITVNATGDGIGAGAMNTSLMVGVQSSVVFLSGQTLNNMAAQVCVNYKVKADGSSCALNTIGASCIGNWYLPSLYELNQMYLQQSVLNRQPGDDAFVWSSTEDNQNDAWRINFTANSNQKSSTSKNDTCGVWCIHAF
jgi:hypothetical protein